MIECWTGRPGSGKSLHMAYDLISELRRGKLCIVNFEVNKEYLKKFKPKGKLIYINTFDMSVQQLKDISRLYLKHFKESQAMIYIDEAAILFNCRNFKDRQRLVWLDFFSKHRKFGYDIVLTTQSIKSLDKQLRDLIEFEVKHIAVRHYKVLGFLISLFTGGCFVAKRVWMGTKERLNSQWLFLNKKKARIYNTFEIFD